LFSSNLLELKTVGQFCMTVNTQSLNELVRQRRKTTKQVVVVGSLIKRKD